MRSIRRLSLIAGSAWSMCSALVVLTPTLAGASTPSPVPSTPSDPALAQEQIAAQELAGQIQAEGDQLAQLSEQADAADIAAHQLTAQIATTKAEEAKTEKEIETAHTTLETQAIAAYINGGDANLAYVERPSSLTDPSVAAVYANTVADEQAGLVKSYTALLASRQALATRLSTQQTQLRSTQAALKVAAASAQAQQDKLRQTLAQVKGQMAVELAKVQAEQEAAAEAAAKAALASKQQAPVPSKPILPSTTVPASPSHEQTTTTSSGTSQHSSPAPSPSPSDKPPVRTAPPASPSNSPPPQSSTPGYRTAIAAAEAEIGKPYQWAGAGPASFDCSGLVMVAWGAAGVALPHLAQGQYDMTDRVPISALLPGDLVFFGTPSDVHHVGIYIGSGQMVDAPETGEFVRIEPMYWSDLLGGGRIVR